jgi:hypothetical protein
MFRDERSEDLLDKHEIHLRVQAVGIRCTHMPDKIEIINVLHV